MKKTTNGLIIEQLEAAEVKSTLACTRSKSEKYGCCTVTTVDIEDENDARILGRDIGRYITVSTDKAHAVIDSDFEEVTDIIADSIRSFVPDNVKRILVAGIGNKNVTPDSLGPKCIERIIVTRGFESVMPELISDDGYASVSAVSADVFGVTGIESAELISGIAAELNPSLVIVIDALAAQNINRLCKTVQISNTAITPGGGVDNARKEISQRSCGCPVLSVGMPTVMDVQALFMEANCSSEICKLYGDALIAVSAQIESDTNNAAKMIAFSINKALHRDMSTEDILRFLY